MPLSADEFQSLFGSFEKSAFRLQLLPEYEIVDEQEDYAKFLAGEPLPERSGIPWLKTMAGQVSRGREWTNVHLLPECLTPYLRYLIDWWYVYQDRAGARIRFLPHRYAQEIHALAPHDFWLFDDRVMILLHYAPSGELLEAEDASSPASLALARRARDFALPHAENLRAILARRRAGSLA